MESGNPGDPEAENGASTKSVEELVAKAIAPVKKQYLLPPRVRNNDKPPNDAVFDDNSPDPPPAPLRKEKKSKRQIKRERREDQKSVLHLCSEVAKSGTVSACRYGDKCRFSHDIESFKAEKPIDIEGNCPFAEEGRPCPYGLACRFSGTHKEDIQAGNVGVKKNESETNELKKDVQKLLWKNKMKFPKADAILKTLGLLGQAHSKKKISVDNKEGNENVADTPHIIDENGCTEVPNDVVTKLECFTEDQEENVDDTSMPDELQPLKKPKPSADEEYSCESNGLSAQDNKLEENREQVSKDDDIITETEENREQVSKDDDIITETEGSLKLHPREKRLIDFSDKLYLAPLTTVGNLPFRRLCKVLGADVTCGEMAMCTNLLQGQASEWALLRRHSSEDLFGVQICGAYPDTVARAVELIDKECTVDFIDINMGCPIDIVVNKGAGSALLTKPMRMKNVIHVASTTVDKPITVKVRTGYFEGRNRIDSIIADIAQWGASAVTIHGRSRQQRYSKLADWDYIYQCAKKPPDALQVMGNGDIFSYLDWNKHKSNCPELSTFMIARGALVKPWLFTEIMEQRNWDISSGERLNILKDYVRFGLEHWGSDSKGVETTRHFLLEWLSYTYRYVPIGLLEVVPPQLNWRPPSYFGRDDLETLMASDSAADWIRISEMLLGKVPTGFTFAPKHKSNAYDSADNG